MEISLDKNTARSRKTSYRWVICYMLLAALVINYLDRQVLSLTWKNFIAPEFGWTDADYGLLTGVFSLVYAVAMLFVGKLIDTLGTKKGYIAAIAVWSTGACLHTFCGIFTNGIVSGDWIFSFAGARENLAALQASSGHAAMAITTTSVWLFLGARVILSLGEAGNFPCSIKAVAEYFPKKDRGFATGVFNSGAQIGALIAPFTIPVIALYWGWEMSFFIIGILGYVWMGVWLFYYKAPRHNARVNAAELAYIEQDASAAELTADANAAARAGEALETAGESMEKANEAKENAGEARESGEKTGDAAVATSQPRVGVFQAFTFRQTWAVIFGRFLPDSVWWFLLFWAPAFISEVYGYSTASPTGMIAIFSIYLISMLSLAGSYLPTYFVNRSKLNPYSGRMKAMLLYAMFPLLGVLVMPLGQVSMWYPVAIIGIMAAAHQSWSANVYNVVSDMFPKSAVATVTGAAGLASGLGSFTSNYGAGKLFTYAQESGMTFMGFEGKEAGYMIVFIIAAVAYLFSWTMMKILVPKYKLVVLK